MSLIAEPTAGAWLTAMPADEQRTIEPVLFEICIQKRLRIKTQEKDTFCNRCGQIMDRWGDHALSCMCVQW